MAVTAADARGYFEIEGGKGRMKVLSLFDGIYIYWQNNIILV